jgi:hypothetical protein
LPADALPEAKTGLDKGVLWVQDMFLSIGTGFTDLANSLNPNVTSNYGGSQEESEDPQGVFLKEFDRGEVKYFEGSPVYVWGIIEAKTLSQRFDIELSCDTEDEEGNIIPGYVDEASKKTSITIPVSSGVDRNLICSFDKGVLKAGTHAVKIYAKFDFAAESNKNIFLMDSDVLNSDRMYLSRQGTEPTAENVLEKNQITFTPEAKSSTGPVLLTLASDPVLWEVSKTNSVPYFFGVQMQNNWDSGGKIDEIKTVYFKVPTPMTIPDQCSGIIPKPVSSSGNQYEAGYNTYELEVNLKDIEEDVAVGCQINVPMTSLDSAAVTRRYIKTHVDYTYSLTQEIDVEVEKIATG